jgi:hypothetical protein
MKKILESVSPGKAARIGSIVYGLSALPVAIVFFMIRPIFGVETTQDKWREFFFYLSVVSLYCIVAGFVIIFSLCLLYNFLAKLFGGIEFTVRDVYDRMGE